jgi:hypothetical protein
MLIEGGGIRDLPASRSQQFVQAIDDGRRPEAGRQIDFEQTILLSGRRPSRSRASRISLKDRQRS